MQLISMSQWIPEYCIVCDKQCVQGSVYCSDKCRCAEKNSDLSKKQHTQYHQANKPSQDNNDFSSDSSDDDSELSGFTLSQRPPNGNTAPTVQSQSAKKSTRKDNHFLYASPKLNPQKNPKISPSMSPLMIPTVVTPEVIHAEQMSVQSVNTYKRWMLSDTN